jgi:hypothetical protein
MARTKKKLEMKPIVPVPTAKAYEARNMYPKYIKPEVKPIISSCERGRGEGRCSDTTHRHCFRRGVALVAQRNGSFTIEELGWGFPDGERTFDV